MKIGIFCYLILDILTTFYRNVSWVVLYQTYLFCCNLVIWLVIRKDLRKNITKSTPQKLCHVCGEQNWNFAELFLTLASIKKHCFLLPLLKHFGFYGNPLTYKGKTENWDLLLSHCRYFDKGFTEMFVEWFSSKHIMLVQTLQFDWLPWQPNS